MIRGVGGGGGGGWWWCWTRWRMRKGVTFVGLMLNKKKKRVLGYVSEGERHREGGGFLSLLVLMMVGWYWFW